MRNHKVLCIATTNVSEGIHRKLSARGPCADFQVSDVQHHIQREKGCGLDFDLEENQSISFRKWNVLGGEMSGNDKLRRIQQEQHTGMTSSFLRNCSVR